MTLTTGQMEDLIDAVRDTSRREIMPHFRNLEPDSISTKVDTKDLVTDVDPAERPGDRTERQTVGLQTGDPVSLLGREMGIS